MNRKNAPRIVRYALAALGVFFLFYGAMDITYKWHVAHADSATVAALDAGVASGSAVVAPTLGSASGSAVVVAGSGSGTDSTNGSTTSPSFTPDPAHPIETVTTAWGLIKQLGWIAGLMVIFFGLGTAAVKLADDEHWLSKDHTLPIATSLLGLLAATINAVVMHGSWAGVAGAAIASVMLIIQKPKPSALAQAKAAG